MFMRALVWCCFACVSCLYPGLNLKTFFVRSLTVSMDVRQVYSVICRLVLHVYKWNRCSVQGNPVIYVLKHTTSITSLGICWEEGFKAEE